MYGFRVLLGLLFTSLLYDVTAANEHLDSIFLRLYIGNSVYIDQKLWNADLLVPKLDNNKTTVLYIHGFTESVDSTSVITVVDAYLKRKDHNVLAVDYRVIANDTYTKVVRSVSDVGAVIANALNEMVQKGLDPEKLHVVSHSLGSQVAGHVGRSTSFQIPRITGLDPAGPLFNFIEAGLTSSDARFVDVIHTDLGFYGTARSLGTVNFFPNGGSRIQPGCSPKPVVFSSEDFCSHHRSWRFYAESVLNQTAFLGIKCQNYFQFVFGGCEKDDVAPMGYATPNTTEGRYYLVTNAESPYGLKEDGLKSRRIRDILPLQQ